MELLLVDPNSLRWSSSFSTTPTNCSTNVLNENLSDNPKLRRFYVQSSIRCSKPVSSGLQKNPRKDLSRILRTESAIRGVENKANSRKYKQLWPKAVLEALEEAIKELRWEAALKIFSLLRKQLWYEPRCQTYTKLLMMLGKCRKPEEASLLFEVMLSEGLKPTVDVYTALVSAYGQSGLLHKAFATVEDMKSVTDCNPDIYTYSILLRCCTKFHQFDLIEHILAEMSYLGIENNSVTYNTIIDGYGKGGMFEHMENSLTNMIESGNCLPDVFTMNSLIGAYGNSGQIEKMEKWYEEFQLMGIKPDIKTFNIMIRSYGKAGVYDKIKCVMDFMERRFFSPTIVTYNTIIEVFGKAGEIEKMDKYFKKMKHLGVKPNSITYCSIVNAYSKAGCIEKVDSIMRQVENSDVVLDTPFFNCVISAYGRAGDLNKMGELFLAMKERKCEPDSITFASMIQAYNTQGMTEAAQKLENMMITAKGSLGMSQLLLLPIAAHSLFLTVLFFCVEKMSVLTLVQVTLTIIYAVGTTKMLPPFPNKGFLPFLAWVDLSSELIMDSYFTVKVHHGGKFEHKERLEYMTIDLAAMGYIGNYDMWYANPNGRLEEELKPIVDDIQAVEMAQLEESSDEDNEEAAQPPPVTLNDDEYVPNDGEGTDSDDNAYEADNVNESDDSDSDSEDDSVASITFGEDISKGYFYGDGDSELRTKRRR
ncbi:pentatricopeptide repeat-containing protein [Senna tora]|uniref:Pentatricopeptide repeat-containing protein n=1 Tax=Senna tora TaxID=362788 RepID=A0A834TMI7_9FABA|nr:pentatricopeptide repeat-containing protein [Senna tora]